MNINDTTFLSERFTLTTFTCARTVRFFWLRHCIYIVVYYGVCNLGGTMATPPPLNLLLLFMLVSDIFTSSNLSYGHAQLHMLKLPMCIFLEKQRSTTTTYVLS